MVWISLASFASSLQPVANLLCAQANSASYPQRDGKWVVVHRLWTEDLVWLIGVVVCHHAALRSRCSLVWATDGHIMHGMYHELMPISCHLWDCQVFLIKQYVSKLSYFLQLCVINYECFMWRDFQLTVKKIFKKYCPRDYISVSFSVHLWFWSQVRFLMSVFLM